MTLATQNPIELEGTYPLPEAQLDRFLLKVRMGYPNAEEELQIVHATTQGKSGDALDVSQVETLFDAARVVARAAIEVMLRANEQLAKDERAALNPATRIQP